MIKLIYQDSQEELVKAAGSLTTLIESERHIKQASSSAISEDLIRNNKPDKNHFAVHLIAMGCEEKYGFNRNGDSWPENDLIEKHGTFVSHGHFFREHRNSDPKLKIGDVKASAYNKPMGRVELIIWGNKKKAEDEYYKAKEGKDLSFSMSARVPYDVCSCCEKQARGSASYCNHLKHHMCQYIPKFRKFAFARNPHPTFFDISKVASPADRIAHWLEYSVDGMEKAASTGVPFSDMLALQEGVSIEDSISGCLDLYNQAMLTKLAKTEQYIADVLEGKDIAKDERYHFLKEAVMRAFEPNDITEEQMSALRQVAPNDLFGGLAKRATTLPFLAFASYSTGLSMDKVADDAVVKVARTMLPSIFRTMEAQPADGELENLFQPTVKFACSNPDPVEKIMDEVSSRHSFAPQKAKVRILRITATHGMDAPQTLKAASSACDADIHTKALKLAKAYGMYKVATCVAAERFGDNCVDEPMQLLVSYQQLI